MEGQAMVDEIRKWHLARSFSDVGYNLLIDKSGDVLPGRSLESIPAAQKGHNKGSIAIMIHGLTDFPQPMLDACKRLCEDINGAYDGAISFHGHCEVANKTCPVIDYQKLLGLRTGGWM
jgi:hypothetical protein